MDGSIPAPPTGTVHARVWPVTVDGRERIQILEDRLRLLLGTLRDFAEATTDYERLVDVVASRLADVVKDGCVVRLLSKDGGLDAAAIHMPDENRVKDPAMVARLREHMAGRRPLSEHAAGRRVIEPGEPLLIPKLDYDQMRASAAPHV